MTMSMRRDPARREALESLMRAVQERTETVAPGHNFTHLERVWHNARIVGEYAARDEGWELDGDVLKAAVFLHDAVPRKSATESHAYESARVAEEMLREHGLGEFVWPVGQAILQHSFSLGREPTSLEARVLCDADRLDALGAVGIARCFSVGTQIGARGFYHPEDPLALHRPLDDRKWMLDHFRVKLFQLPGKMFTRYGRAEAIRRVKVLRGFYDAMLKEAGFSLQGTEKAAKTGP